MSIENHKIQNGWVSVKNSLPTVDKDYLVTDGSCCMVSRFIAEQQKWYFWSISWWANEDVTHWMNLPLLNDLP